MLNKKKIIFNQPLKISNRQQKKLSFDEVPLAPIPHRVVGFIVDWIIVLFLIGFAIQIIAGCLLYTSPSPRDGLLSRMPSSA